MTFSPAFKTTLGYVPKQGSRALQVQINFTALVQTFSRDLLNEQMSGGIELVQGVYIDNGSNPTVLSLAFNALGQIITVKGNTQGYYPLLVPNGKLNFVATSAVAGPQTVNLIFTNIFVNPSVWASV